MEAPEMQNKVATVQSELNSMRNSDAPGAPAQSLLDKVKQMAKDSQTARKELDTAIGRFLKYRLAFESLFI